jgi:hypothetical protein
MHFSMQSAKYAERSSNHLWQQLLELRHSQCCVKVSRRGFKSNQSRCSRNVLSSMTA